MNVYWLEQTHSDVPEDDGWLSASEVARMYAFRYPGRRADWRLGRWTAKRAVAACRNAPLEPSALAAMEIRPSPSGAPEVVCAGWPMSLTISLSHRAGVAICAVAEAGAALGCDLELIEPRSDAFIADYFTAEEQDLVAHASDVDRLRLVALLWSAKESVLKALRVGLRFDTRSVVVCPQDALRRVADGDTWHALRARHIGGETFRGWWQNTRNLLRTVVAHPPPAPPTLLEPINTLNLMDFR